MSKIICDVCGTDYPETAAQCPICGCASAGAQTAAGNDAADIDDGPVYTPVKGGRYSKANVRKRLQENQKMYAPKPILNPEYEDDAEQEDQYEDEDRGSNRGLLVVVAILLLAIVAVAAYICVSMFGNGFGSSKSNNKPTTYPTNPTTLTTEAPSTDPTIDPTTEPTTEAPVVECTSLSVSDVDIALDTVGGVHQLTVTPVPADTTDEVVFTSTDESVVTVSQNGLVTAVGNGTASIIITCGDVTVDCPVLCELEEEQPTQGNTGTGTYTLMINGKISPYGDEYNAEVSQKVGEKFRMTIEDAEGNRQDVTWEFSKEGICSMDGYNVVGEAAGKVTLTATIDGQTYTCLVIVK